MSLVTFPTPAGTEASGYLALPSGSERRGALMVIHEWWGLNDETRAMTDRFAAEGFLALAVDLYRGAVTADPAEAMRLSSQMKTEEALVDLRGAITLLASHARSNGKVGITGFCLGGAVTLSAAFQVDGLSAALPFYGNPRADLVDFARRTPPSRATTRRATPSSTAPARGRSPRA